MSLPELFSVTTAQFQLSWAAKQLRPTDREDAWRPPGRLSVRTLGRSLPAPDVQRHVPKVSGLDESAAAAADFGPRLSEETEYFVYLKPQGGTVDVQHDDPTVTSQLRTESDGTIHGTINFRSNVGLSDFRIMVDGRPAYAITVQVFPTKLDYESDYEVLVADVQDIATSLALEYLRSTYQLGRTEAGEEGDELQWVLLLRHIFDDLERGLRHVAARPRRSVVRNEVLTPVHQIRRPDSSVRRSVRRRKGSGPIVDVGRGLAARSKLWSQPARQTLDTPEHRWLAHQVRIIQQRLSRLVRSLNVDEEEEASRRRTQVDQLRQLESAASRLGRLEPLAAASGPPPPGFASQQLTSAPGYREAYQACLILRAGLHLEGDALRLSTKELHQLYEYWCYLVVVRLLAKLLDAPQEPKPLFKVQASGLRLNLSQGHASEVVFGGEHHRVRVRYNPSFRSSSIVLVPQRPDILVTLEHDGWPALHLVLDAKYRVDDSSPYINRYGGAGPPDDALNVLHRYRDAILEEYEDAPARHVVQAAAMFPGRDSGGSRHGDTKHWLSLEKIGIGALPALPDATDYLEKWLRNSLRHGGWQLADRSIPHAAHRRLEQLRNLEAGLVWIIASDDVTLARVRNEGSLRLELGANREAIRASWIGLLRRVGERAELALFEVDSRRRVAGDEVHQGPQLLELQLRPLSENRTFRGDRAPHEVEGVTSQLAVQRATALSELALDRVEDWRLRDALFDRGMLVAVETDYETLPQRPWLRTAAEDRVRYEGRDGYYWEGAGGQSSRFADFEGLLTERVDRPYES